MLTDPQKSQLLDAVVQQKANANSNLFRQRIAGILGIVPGSREASAIEKAVYSATSNEELFSLTEEAIAEAATIRANTLPASTQYANDVKEAKTARYRRADHPDPNCAGDTNGFKP